MLYKYRISFQQQLLLLWQPILTYILVFGAIYYYTGGNIDKASLIFTGTFIFIFDSLPTVILHTQYIIKNWGGEFTIDEEKRTISYKTPKINIDNVPFGEISSFVYYVSYGRKTGVYSFARYRYYKIGLNDGRVFFVTCLMMNDIENTLEMMLHLKAEKELSFLCFLT